MSYSKTLKLINDCLKFSISKDETRLQLNGIYYDPKLEQAVSTNGYVMTYSKHKYIPEFADKIVDFKDMSIISGEFLKYSSVIPVKFKESEIASIPKTLIVKQKRPTVKAFYVKGKGFILSEIALDSYEFAINPEFLKPLVGHHLEFEWNNDLAPIRVTIQENDTYYIIMPMKV